MKKNILLRIVGVVASFVFCFAFLCPVLAKVSATEELTDKELVAGTGFTAVATTEASISSSVTAEYPKAAFKAGVAATESATGKQKVYVNSFSRGCATVVTFTEAIAVADYPTITFGVSKNIGAKTTLDFYRNESATVIGETASLQTEIVSSTTYNNNVANIQTPTVSLAPFANDGLVSSFIVVHTWDERVDPNGNDDYEAFTLNIYNITCIAYIPPQDYTLSVENDDMSVAKTTAQGTLATPSGWGKSSGATAQSQILKNIYRLYVNDFAEYAGFELKFKTPINANTHKNLVLTLMIYNRTVTNTAYWSHYIDLFKAGTEKINHADAVASYSVFHGLFKSAIVINLADFADENGLVSSIIFYHHDETSAGVAADSVKSAVAIMESQVLVNEVTKMTKAAEEVTGYFWAMPDKKATKETFVGWNVNGKLYGAYNLWNDDGVEATPVYVKFYVADGAYIRADEPTGLRFITHLGKDSYDYLKAQGTLTFGTLIKCAGSAEELNVPRVNSWVDSGESYSFNGVMVDIQEDYYGYVFTATGYMDITYETGRTMRIWAAQGDTERSIAQVAYRALQDPTATWSEDQIDMLEKYSAGYTEE